ncbi:MAG: arsenate reductase (glutaredoxin) [Immundisolibacter sp.]|uniref:arsenate reductase (glutaredoxin) n=1 Tax=Immundisolibacter sp. TaxID=1934948 RepID=UPI003EDF565D
MSIRLYHNPRCSKSREALALLRERGVEPQIVEYLKEAPTTAELERLLKQLDLEPRQLMRRGEAVYKELDLDQPALSRAALIDALATHPILIERPIAISGERAVIGRPPQKVLELL